MNSALNHLIAAEHVSDLRRTAERQRAVPRRTAEPHAATIQLRPGGPDDAGVLRHLAELDSAPELAPPVLLAVSDGRPIAALSLRDQRVVADPFVLTGDAVALLRLRSEHLSASRTRRRLRRRLRFRFA